MQAIQLYPSHPNFLIHQYQYNGLQKRDFLKTPEKKTKPRNLSPNRKSFKLEDFNENVSQDHEPLQRVLFF